MRDDAFNRTKNDVELFVPNKEIDCLRAVSLNISEACQLTCSYCPHGNSYENNTFMSMDVVHQTIERLDQIGFAGTVSISGMGEPSLHPEAVWICEEIGRRFKLKFLTNGLAPIDYEAISRYAKIMVSIHHIEQEGAIRKHFRDIDVIYRNHDISSSQCELKQTNRAGSLEGAPGSGICNYPFYKTMVDYDGSYLLCCDDWNRASKDPMANVFDMSLEEYFCEYLRKTKELIMTKGRQASPCCQCSTNGKMIGDGIVEWYKEHVS